MPFGLVAAKVDVLVLLGTRKGGFFLASSKSCKDWALTGPYCAGSELFHMI